MTKATDQNLEIQTAVTTLEAKYADRGLKFTSAFEGLEPEQAYGHLDGLRFYFRLRGSLSKLRLGPYDKQIEELVVLRYEEREALRAQSSGAAYMLPLQLVLESDPEFYPRRVLKQAVTNIFNPEKGWTGANGAEGTVALFSFLADNLVDVPEEEQLESHSRVYLFEGVEASWAQWALEEKEASEKAFLAEK